MCYEYLMILRGIRNSEKRRFNKFDFYPSMSINVYTFEDNGNTNTLQISDIYDADIEIYLLFYKKGDNSH